MLENLENSIFFCKKINKIKIKNIYLKGELFRFFGFFDDFDKKKLFGGLGFIMDLLIIFDFLKIFLKIYYYYFFIFFFVIPFKVTKFTTKN